MPDADSFSSRGPTAGARRRAVELLDRHGLLLRQFIQFGIIGTVGFLVDYAVLHTAHFEFGVPLIPASVLSFLFAATGNWFLNRIWTFRGASTGRLHHEWLRYLGTNAIGFVLNRGTFTILVMASALCVRYPVIPLAAGSFAGLGMNFVMSRKIVFK